MRHLVDGGMVKDAWQHAGRSTEKCGVEIRPVSGTEVRAAQDVIAEAWGSQQVPQGNLIQALAHAGNPVLVAFRDARPVGVCFGFLGWSGQIHLHSHMTAVTRNEQSAGIGYALKLAQRAMCLEHGITEMRWTYDPLIARNAYFNLVKLGARVQDFLPDFYGAMDDLVNVGDRSDRFEVSWSLDAAEVVAALEGEQPVAPPSGEIVAVPADYDAVRRADPEAARALRLTARQQFARLFDAGLTPCWANGVYVFARSSEPSPGGKSSGDSRG